MTLTGQIELLARGAHLLQPACSTGLQEEGDNGKMGFPLVFFFKQYGSTRFHEKGQTVAQEHSC